jgi:hypothetical protein
MPEIANCPKCGATAGTQRKGIHIIYFYCVSCDIQQYTDPHLTNEQNLASWNSQPVIERLRAEVAELKEAARWIPVEERLPKECEDVFVTNVFRNIRIGFYNGDRWIDNTSTRTPEVTHWRPLPNPPDALP